MAAEPGDGFSSRGDVPLEGPARGAPEADRAADDGHDEAGPAAVRRLRRQLEELGEFARFYLAARMDAISGSARRIAIWLALGALGLIVIGAYLVTSVVVFILGVAEIIGRALGDRFWAGNLITGLGLLLIFGLILFVAISSLTRSSRERTVRRYVRRRQQQKARFGHDVQEQAGARQSSRK